MSKKSTSYYTRKSKGKKSRTLYYKEVDGKKTRLSKEKWDAAVMKGIKDFPPMVFGRHGGVQITTYTAIRDYTALLKGLKKGGYLSAAEVKSFGKSLERLIAIVQKRLPAPYE